MSAVASDFQPQHVSQPSQHTRRASAHITLVGREVDVVRALLQAGRDKAPPYDLALLDRVIGICEDTLP